jgi:hypothetical protein
MPKTTRGRISIKTILMGVFIVLVSVALIQGGVSIARVAGIALVILAVVFFREIASFMRSVVRNFFVTRPNNATNTEAVIVYLAGSALPKEIYEEYDVATLEDRLRSLIREQGLGEYDGNEHGSSETVLYMYAPDSERLFNAIEPVLRSYPLCVGAKVVIRRGGLGSKQRELLVE